MKKLVYLASHCLFDGWMIKNIGRYIIGYSNKSVVLINNFSETVTKLTGKIPYQRTRPNAIEIEFGNKKLLTKILKIVNIKKYFLANFYNKLLKNNKLIFVVLRAFWDDEGTVGFYVGTKKTTRKLRGRCLNFRLRHQLIALHNVLGINAYEEYDKKGLLITGRDSIKLFAHKINFTIGVKVVKTNGQKPRWLGFEKTKVLDLLLNSYKK